MFPNGSAVEGVGATKIYVWCSWNAMYYSTKKISQKALRTSQSVWPYLTRFYKGRVSSSHQLRKNEKHDLIPVLVDEGYRKADCFNVLLKAGIKLPKIYMCGYPNANRVGCVKATSPTYWNHVREQDPDVFEHWAKQSRNIGAHLVRYKGERIFIDELRANTGGAPLKNLDFECGIFCQKIA